MMKKLNIKKANNVIYVDNLLILMKIVNITKTTKKLRIIVIIPVNTEALHTLYVI